MGRGLALEIVHIIISDFTFKLEIQNQSVLAVTLFIHVSAWLAVCILKYLYLMQGNQTHFSILQLWFQHLVIQKQIEAVAHTRLTSTKRFTNLKVNLTVEQVQTCILFLQISYGFEYFLGSEDALNPFSSKVMALTLRGGL